MATKPLRDLLEGALVARESLFEDNHQTGFRLFNGFSEGQPELVIDLYARTALIHNYASSPVDGEPAVQAAQEFLQTHLPWLECIVLKTRNGRTAQDKQGSLLYGNRPA